MKNEKINGSKDRSEGPVTSEEKAQYEVFRNGSIPRETVRKYLRNDLESIVSLGHSILVNDKILDLITDEFYARYTQLHKSENDVAG